MYKILSMSGFIPEQICDIVRFTGFAGEYNISQYCGYAADFISQVMQDEVIDGAVFPKSCDSTRILASYIEDTDKFVHQLRIPSRRDRIAVDYFAASIQEYKEHVEKYFSISLHDVAERSETVNKRNQRLRDLYRNVDSFSYEAYLTAIHEMLKRPLYDQRVPLSLRPAHTAGKKVFLVGSCLANLSIVRKIEESGLMIVGDTLPESGRVTSAPMVDSCSGQIYHEIAKNILYMRMSPTQDQFQDILKKDLAEIKQKKVDGVVFVTQKYCEPYDFLFSVYKKALDELKIPVLKISVFGTEDDGKSALAIEAFADALC